MFLRTRRIETVIKLQRKHSLFVENRWFTGWNNKDMLPNTKHVECVVLMSRVTSK